MLTAADNSTVPGDTDATTATDGNSTGDEEPTRSSPTPTAPGSPGPVDPETIAPMVAAPMVAAPMVTAPMVTAPTTSTNDASTNDATTSGDATTSDGAAEPSSARVTDSAAPADPASASTIGDGIEPNSADGSDPAKIDADVPVGASLALDVSPVPVAHDVDRSGGSEGGPGPRQTTAVVASPRAMPDAIADVATTDAATATSEASLPVNVRTPHATVVSRPVDVPTPDVTVMSQPVNVPTPDVSVVSRPVIVPTPDVPVVSQPVIVPTPHNTATVVVAAEPVAEPAAAPVTEPVLHTSTTAAGAATDLADGSLAADGAGTPARADAVRPATEVPAAVADRQAAASGSTPSSPSVVSSGTGAGVPVSTTLPFAGADLAAWRHLRSGSTSTMSMEVDTDTLGQLRIAASDLDGAVRLSLLSDDALSRQLLAERLPELRRDFADAGIDFADLDVADRNAGHRHSESSDRTDRAATSPTGPPTATTDRLAASISSPQTVPTGHLDLRL